MKRVLSFALVLILVFTSLAFAENNESVTLLKEDTDFFDYGHFKIAKHSGYKYCLRGTEEETNPSYATTCGYSFKHFPEYVGDIFTDNESVYINYYPTYIGNKSSKESLIAIIDSFSDEAGLFSSGFTVNIEASNIFDFCTISTFNEITQEMAPPVLSRYIVTSSGFIELSIVSSGLDEEAQSSMRNTMDIVTADFIYNREYSFSYETSDYGIEIPNTVYVYYEDMNDEAALEFVKASKESINQFLQENDLVLYAIDPLLQTTLMIIVDKPIVDFAAISEADFIEYANKIIIPSATGTDELVKSETVYNVTHPYLKMISKNEKMESMMYYIETSGSLIRAFVFPATNAIISSEIESKYDAVVSSIN